MLGFEKAPSRRSLSSDLSWGFWRGCVLAAGLSLFAVFGVAFLGGGARLRQTNTTLGELVVVYWLTFPAAGLFVGLLRPTLNRAGSRWLTFTLAAGLVVGGVWYLWRGPPTTWTPKDWFLVSLLSSWYGLLSAYRDGEREK